MSHVNTMIELTDVLINLNHVQDLIDFARNACPANQHLQLEMDRKQVDVDKRRAFVKQMITDIALRN